MLPFILVAWALPSLVAGVCPSYRYATSGGAVGETCIQDLSLAVTSSGTLRLPVLATVHNIHINVSGPGVTFSLFCDVLVNVTGTVAVVVGRGGYLQHLGLPVLESVVGALTFQTNDNGRIDTISIATGTQAKGLIAGDVVMTGAAANSTIRLFHIGRILQCGTLYIDPFDSTIEGVLINNGGATDRRLSTDSLIVGTRGTNGRLGNVTVDWLQDVVAMRVEGNAAIYGVVALNPSATLPVSVEGQVSIRLRGPGQWSLVQVGAITVARLVLLEVSAGGQVGHININTGGQFPLTLQNDLQLNMFSNGRLNGTVVSGLRRANSVTIVARDSGVGSVRVNSAVDCNMLTVNTIQVVADTPEVVHVYGVNVTHLVSAVPSSTVLPCATHQAASAGKSTAALVGGLVAALAAVAMLACLVWRCRKRPQGRRTASAAGSVRITRQLRWNSSRRNVPPPLPPRLPGGEPVYAVCEDPPLPQQTEAYYDIASETEFYEVPLEGYLHIEPASEVIPDEPLYDLATTSDL